MTAIIIIGIIIFIIFAASINKKPIQQNTTYSDSNNKKKSEKEIRDEFIQTLIKNITVTETLSTSSNKNNDDSIIDVTGRYENIITNNYNNTYDDWKLGNKYKQELNLNKNEVDILNNLIDTDNKFNSIHFCAIELIRLLFNCINFLEEQYKIKNIEFGSVINGIAHIEITKNYRYRTGSYNYNNILSNFRYTVYQCIYKTCENYFRDYFEAGRKTDLTWYLRSNEAINSFNEQVKTIIHPYVINQLLQLNKIDVESEIKINNYNRTRYKTKLKDLAFIFDSNRIDDYSKEIIELEIRNKENPFIENIYFEASKFISNYNKELALEYYIKYLYHDLKSVTFDNKQLTKTIQKNLFKTNEQLHNFQAIISELINDRNLEKALQELTKIYKVKRKKIQLDSISIKEVQKQHSGTVELLNEYLKDDYEDENNTIKTQEINNEEIKIEITQKTTEIQQSIYIYNSVLRLTEINSTALEYFEKSNFSISKLELEAFAKSKGVFKNQLIESINEACYEFLDDVLIEEEDEHYTINTDYYQRILTK